MVVISALLAKNWSTQMPELRGRCYRRCQCHVPPGYLHLSNSRMWLSSRQLELVVLKAMLGCVLHEWAKTAVLWACIRTCDLLCTHTCNMPAADS